MNLVVGRSLVNGNYINFCDQDYREDSSIILRGYQLLLPSNSTNNLSNNLSNIKYLLIKDANTLNECAKRCCLDEFNCDISYFNNSSNVCLHIICIADQNSTQQQCPPMRKDDKQSTSLIRIRSPTNRTSSIKYRNELSRESLINEYGLLPQEDQLDLMLKSKFFGTRLNKEPTKSSGLTVIVNKNPILQLPNDSITINAYVHPPSNQYIYKWTLVSRPNENNQQDSGSLEEQNTDSLKLNKLIEGNYSFNVSVFLPNNPNIIGQESVNLTVLPPKRINSPPQAIIQPSNSVVQLPKQEIVLDGSLSVDDDRIINYKWSLVKAPIGFEIPSNDLETETLKLKNLVAGNYSFRLLVTDSDNSTSVAQADLTVLKEKDYPPTAIVNQDLIIFLPQNSVTLSGNQSTDDKKIVSYEWTVIDENDGSNKQTNNMDMSGVKTPFLHLSNLDVGVYKAVLKVTDSSNQISTAETHVFVKPEIDIKPEAIIKTKPENQKIYMPLKENVVLDGKDSKDVSKGGILHWKWSQISGPRQSIIVSPNNSTTNVTGLTPGQYKYVLEIINSKNLSSNATTTIEVFPPNENAKPIANAGGNQTINLNNQDIVILNGSKSYDDLIDLKYTWTREPNSLAIGDIIEHSDHSPILKLSNLIVGDYFFKLTVEDSQGAKSEDRVVINVKAPGNIKQTVEVLLNVNFKQFRYEQQNALLKKLEILLSSNIDEIVRLSNVKLYPIYDSELTLLKFTVEVLVSGKSVNLSAIEVVKRLRLRLRNDKSLVDAEILSVKTSICQNTCSGHGYCVERTKECKCDTFWMQNFLRFHYGDALENCDWSVLYVCLFSILSFILVCALMWNFLCCFIRRRTIHLNFNKIRPRLRLKKRKPRQTKYTLLKQQNGLNKVDNQSSDESESEIEHRNKMKKNNINNIEAKIKIKNGNSKPNYKNSSESDDSEIIEYDFKSISRRGYS